MRRLRTGVFLFFFALAASGLAAQQMAGHESATDWGESPIKPEISGFVRLAAGNGVPNRVLVRLETPTGSRLQETWTGKLGEFSFPQIACGNYVLAIDAPGFQPVRVAVEHSYIPLGSLFLRLVTAESNEPAQPLSPVNEKPIPREAQKEYEKGLESLMKKHPDQSVAHFRKAVTLFPEYETAYLQLGWAQIQLRAFADADNSLQQALRLNNKSAAAYALMGKVRREQNRFADAVPQYEHSIALEEASWRTQLELGDVLLKLDRVPQAYPHLRRAHELNPAQPLTHLQLYNCLILRSDYAGAKAELDEFLNLFPHHALVPRIRQQRDNLQAKLQTIAKH